MVYINCLLHTHRLILSVRDTCVDWMRGVEPHDDPAMKGKKDPDEGFTIKVPRRNVGPSTTQVNCLSFNHIVIPVHVFGHVVLHELI